MAKSVADITGDFSKFLEHFRDYCKKQGEPEYNEERFQWFRPDNVTDTTDLQNISEPYSLSEVEEMAVKLSDPKTGGGNEGDYDLVMTQTDLITSAARSHAERYKSKLRYFAHATGSHERIGEDYGVLQQGVMRSLTEIKKRASSDIS